MDTGSSAETLNRLLQDRFKLEAFRKGQLDILSSVLQNQDALAVMPTGGGKSLCYQLPAVYRKGIVLVISPLISLMKDQVRSLMELGIPAGCLHSGQKRNEKLKVFSDMKENEHFILYLSPERVQKPGFSQWLKDKPISLIAIDESHCVSQWGPDFREDYYRLKIFRQIRPEVPILALTASATPMVLRDIITQLELKEPARHIYGFYRPNLYYQVEICPDAEFKLAMLRKALAQHSQGRVLIYCGTRKQCEELVETLGPEFPEIDYYHAGLETERRHQVQRAYEEGSIRILAATNAFGMGIDHPDVRLVVHFQMPANIESYYQEMGRAGRDGEDSTCLLLYSRKDKGLHSYFILKSEAEEAVLKKRWRALDTICQYAEGGECRHAGILTYFRDSQRLAACGHCDTCSPDSHRRIAKPLPPEAPQRASKKRRSKERIEDLTSPEAEFRAQALREWRKNYAQANDMPAFLVFSNKALNDLAAKAPRTLSDLEKVYGIGPHKVENFGKMILEVIENCRGNSWGKS